MTRDWENNKATQKPHQKLSKKPVNDPIAVKNVASISLSACRNTAFATSNGLGSKKGGMAKNFTTACHENKNSPKKQIGGTTWVEIFRIFIGGPV